jgi:hypothetical protein
MAPVQYLPRQAGERQRLVQGLGAEAGVTGARFAPVRCGVPRLPSRAAAIRELLKRGLAAEGFEASPFGAKSEDYGVTGVDPKGRKGR